MKKLTLGKRIGLGFALVITITAVAGVTAIFTMRSVRESAENMASKYVPEARIGAQLAEVVASTQIATRSYGLTADERFLKEVRSSLITVDQRVNDLQSLTITHPELVKLKQLLPEVQSAFRHFVEAVDQTEAGNHRLNATREKMNAAAAVFMEATNRLIASQDEQLDREVKDFAAADRLLERHHKLSLAKRIQGAGNAARIAAFKGQALRETKLITDGLSNFETMHKSLSDLRALLHSAADIAEIDAAASAADSYRDAMTELTGDLTRLDDIAKGRTEAGAALTSAATTIAETGMTRAVSAADESRTILTRTSVAVTSLVGGGAFFAIGAAFMIVRGTSRILLHVAGQLNAGSSQIAAASTQVAASSQTLAQGASEQAASVEETSASVEEMAGMTKRNSEGATKAQAAAHRARESADRSASSIQHLSTAMQELQTSSEDVRKIVKTIDEIAFQTNILALNAAVEAARAGEAGAGFAVVADEVRSLAQRAAAAAKETAQKVESASMRSAEGARIGSEVEKGLASIITEVRSLDMLVAEIAQASREQSEGIGQINIAISQVDRVTQSNASGAEECAAAAEELNAQAKELNVSVAELLELVGATAPSAGSQRDEIQPPIVGGDTKISLSLIRDRVKRGGHTVPEDKIAT